METIFLSDEVAANIIVPNFHLQLMFMFKAFTDVTASTELIAIM